MNAKSNHQPLHLLKEGQSLFSAGRVRREKGQWWIYNAFTDLELDFAATSGANDDLVEGALIRVGGHLRDDLFVVEWFCVVHQPYSDPPPLQDERGLPIGTCLRARHHLNRRIHRFFDQRSFLEVQTPAWVRAPGTDPHIEPVRADFQHGSAPEDRQTGYLHTSPELSMKRLLSAGAGPIYQLGSVWRNGEVTPLHNPEFQLLEWYRPWRAMEAIMADVEQLVGSILDDQSGRPVEAPFLRITMRELVDRACGFDLLEALDADSLRHQIRRRKLLSDRAMSRARWDELFYSLTVSHLDPYLSTMGPVFVTHWPSPLAVLAKKDDDDPRVARRFELYVDGVELANGFGELTDPDEQLERFVDDNATRRLLNLGELPVPRAFLRALEWGLPPSAGVALGVDRLLVLATPDASCLLDINPFAFYRDVDGIQWP